jgi:haloalkane dehalogenase
VPGVLRTPEARFAAIPDVGEPRYADVPHPAGGVLRMAYLDVGGSRSGSAGEPGATVVLLHGEPTWSYLYRTMIPVLAAAGLRVIAPDLIGFGRSDKPVGVAEHTYARHIGWVRGLLVDHLALRGATLVCQDWGGLIGLRLAVENDGLFDRVVAANTGLPTGDQPLPEVWWAMRHAMTHADPLDIARGVAAGCRRGLSAQARAGYDAPFPGEEYKAGPRAMPGLVPVTPDDPQSQPNRAAWAALGRWTRPFLVAFSDSDPITGAMAPVLRRHVPGAAGLAHPTIADAGHFLQEDAGPELAEHVVRFVRTT